MKIDPLFIKKQFTKTDAASAYDYARECWLFGDESFEDAMSYAVDKYDGNLFIADGYHQAVFHDGSVIILAEVEKTTI